MNAAQTTRNTYRAWIIGGTVLQSEGTLYEACKAIADNGAGSVTYIEADGSRRSIAFFCGWEHTLKSCWQAREDETTIVNEAATLLS